MAVKAYFEGNLPQDAEIYNHFHALIVVNAKEHCKKKPLCKGCPLGKLCGKGKEVPMGAKTFEYEALIQAADKGGAYVSFPHDIRAVFGKGRVKVHATFDGEPYDGSIVNMGVKNADGSVCYIIGILKNIRAKIGKQVGDVVRVTVTEMDIL